jgi:hypothetical protein
MAPYCIPPPSETTSDLRISAQEDATPRRAVVLDEPSPLRGLRRITRRAAKPDGARPDKASAPSESPERYSDEWWKQQGGLDDKLKPKLIICRGC